MSAERVGSAVQQNTSGQGKGTELPDELKGLNWGAFFFNWIWGLLNKTYIALLALAFPIGGMVAGFVLLIMGHDKWGNALMALFFAFGFVMVLVLLFKGNKWAWANKPWDDHDHFRRVQRRWGWAALIFILLTPPTVAGEAEAKPAAEPVTKQDAKPEAKPAMEQKGKSDIAAIRAGVGRGDPKAIRPLKVLAAKGNTDAQVLLGDLYLTGKGVFKNGSLAGTWYQSAAEKGNALGQYKIAIMYLEGVFLPLDFKAAGKWLKKAAQQGHAGARKTLETRLGETPPPVIKPKAPKK